MNARIILICFFGIGLLAGCAEKPEVKPLTVTELIAGKDKKAWKLQFVEVVDEGVVDGPYSAGEVLMPCESDDEYVFYNNEERTYECTAGSVKCGPNQPDVWIRDSWSYTLSNATFEFALPLNLFGEIYILPFNVKKLTENEMVLEVFFDNLFQDGTDASYRITLRAK